MSLFMADYVIISGVFVFKNVFLWLIFLTYSSEHMRLNIFQMAVHGNGTRGTSHNSKYLGHYVLCCKKIWKETNTWTTIIKTKFPNTVISFPDTIQYTGQYMYFDRQLLSGITANGDRDTNFWVPLIFCDDESAVVSYALLLWQWNSVAIVSPKIINFLGSSGMLLEWSPLKHSRWSISMMCIAIICMTASSVSSYKGPFLANLMTKLERIHRHQIGNPISRSRVHGKY